MDSIFLERCLQLAKNGKGLTYPNPLVGAVIVHNQIIIGEGWHRKAGSDHAEIIAIQSVKDKSKLKECTLYVSLEPCSHFGKTAPCSDAIILHQIPKVIIASKDSNIKIQGIEKLKNKGIEVEIFHGIEKREKELNKSYTLFLEKKRPYIILKWGYSKDGFVDANYDKPIKISNPYSHQLSHKWRTEEAAILIGKNTAIKDKPRLNARHWIGSENFKIIIDKKLEVPTKDPIFKQNNVLVFNDIKNDKLNNTEFLKIDFNKDILPQIMNILFHKNIQSIIIEGGPKTLQSFIDANLWDEARVFKGANFVHNGIQAPNFPFIPKKEIYLKGDQLFLFYNE